MLLKLLVSSAESDSHWQQNDYKSFNPSVNWDTVDFSKSPAIQDMPVTSAICEPSNHTVVKVSSKNGNEIKLKGYAWAGSGNRIIRVDLTPDKGKEKYSNQYISRVCLILHLVLKFKLQTIIIFIIFF